MPKPQGRLKTPKSLSVDFSGVERGGGGTNPRLPEGDYLTRIVSCELKSKKGDPSRKHLLWGLKILEGSKKGVGKIFKHRTGLTEESLWSLRGFLMDTLGESKVPQSAVDIPIAAIVKKQPKVGITLEDDEYNDKPTSKVSATFPASDWADLKAGAESDDEDEDEEEDEDDEEEETEDEEDEEEDEEEEEPAPKKKTKKVKEKKAKKKTKKPVVEDDEDEDDEDEIDVDEL
jgi:hypothetical protein